MRRRERRGKICDGAGVKSGERRVNGGAVAVLLKENEIIRKIVSITSSKLF